MIRMVGRNNFESFFSLLTKMASYEKITPPDKNAKKRLFQDCISKHPKYQAYLIQKGNKYLGFVILVMVYSSFLGLPTLFIEDIFVLEEYRRRGVGQKIFAFCVNFAKKNKCKRIEWWTFNWNTPALSFYKKNKAEPLDVTYFRYSV